MVEQARGQNTQQVEAMRAQLATTLQQMKDDAAHDREELKAWKDIVLQKMQPPPALASEVAGNAQDS